MSQESVRVKVLASAVIFGHKGQHYGEVLLTRSSGQGQWRLPSGEFEKDEAPESAITRITDRDESFYVRFNINSVIGVYIRPAIGHVVFACRCNCMGEALAHEEPEDKGELSWFHVNDLPESMLEYDKECISDGLEHRGRMCYKVQS